MRYQRLLGPDKDSSRLLKDMHMISGKDDDIMTQDPLKTQARAQA
jgi:hypothetical protein